jgi:NAD(P)-dependent dehydrogenase (short-subunit alcohol dehydrogenase family)
MDLNGSSAVVSGGASGLGEATARDLAAHGAKVVVADLNEEKGKALAGEIGGVFVSTDVSDEQQVQAAVDAAVATGVPLRAIVNSAGIGWASRTVGRDGSPHDLATYKKVIEVNLIGTFNLMRIGAAAIAKTDPVDEDGLRGVVINTASVAALEGQTGQVAYSASKGGIVGMTLPAARDLASARVRVCTIAPGLFDTPLLAGLPDEAREALAASIPHPARLGTPDEYGALAAHIVENPMLNGEVIRLDGALRMAPR